MLRVCRVCVICNSNSFYYVPRTQRVGGYIVLGADPDGVYFFSVHYPLNQLMDFDQTWREEGEELI